MGISPRNIACELNYKMRKENTCPMLGISGFLGLSEIWLTLRMYRLVDCVDELPKDGNTPTAKHFQCVAA
jgi:hypothetical protein